MSTTIAQAPAHTIADLVRNSKAYLDQNFPRHRAETLNFELLADDLANDMSLLRMKSAPRHRMDDSKAKHKLWSIDQD